MLADGLFERISRMELEACKGQNASPLFLGAKTVNNALCLLNNSICYLAGVFPATARPFIG